MNTAERNRPLEPGTDLNTLPVGHYMRTTLLDFAPEPLKLTPEQEAMIRAYRGRWYRDEPFDAIGGAIMTPIQLPPDRDQRGSGTWIIRAIMLIPPLVFIGVIVHAFLVGDLTPEVVKPWHIMLAVPSIASMFASCLLVEL